MDKGNQTTNKKGHLFTVEVLIESYSNGLALETLIHLLNSDKIKDYQVKNGIELGNIIELNKKESKKELTKKNVTIQQPPNNDEQYKHTIAQLEQFKQNNTLVRLYVNKGKGVKLSIPCRILNFDTATENVSVYHVDEKKVYLLKLYEIDDFVLS